MNTTSSKPTKNSNDLFYHVEFKHEHEYYNLESFNKMLKEKEPGVLKENYIQKVTLLNDIDIAEHWEKTLQIMALADYLNKSVDGVVEPIEIVKMILQGITKKEFGVQTVYIPAYKENLQNIQFLIDVIKSMLDDVRKTINHAQVMIEDAEDQMIKQDMEKVINVSN